jgi:hypothetical protein
MTKRIDPGLFARLMKMSSETRRDILEFLGQTPVDADDVVRRAADIDDGQSPALNPSKR